MKIYLGKILQAHDESIDALWWDDFGAMPFQTDKDGFGVIDLTTEQMELLRDLLIKELSDEQANIQ